MPAPPPPPPLAPAAPPPPTSMFKSSKSSKSSANDRDALLKSIQKGAKLKKTVTNDRSAPQLGGSTNKSSNGGGLGGGMGGMLPVVGLGGLGSGLKNGNGGGGGGSVSPAVSPMGGMKNFGSIQMELKKQLANDNRNRGPPPPTPTRNVSSDSGSRQQFGQRENVTNGFHMSQLSLNSNTPSNIHVNQSSLHRKAKSNANLSSWDSPDNSNGLRLNKTVVNYGKPNLAPKPPVSNGKPNSLQLKMTKPVSRTHSLKSPRSPSPQSPEINPINKFGTVKHMSSIISQSLANSSTHNPRPRPALSTRPSAPPPSIPVPATPNHQSISSSHTSTPPKVNMVKPNHAPPPPPPVIVPQAPSHAAPPPPPHKTQLNKAPVPTTGSNPPSPPPRHSSMRDNPSKKSSSLEERFKHLFQSSSKFPSPPPYKNVIKLYNSVSVKPAPVKPVAVA